MVLFPSQKTNFSSSGFTFSSFFFSVRDSSWVSSLKILLFLFFRKSSFCWRSCSAVLNLSVSACFSSSRDSTFSYSSWTSGHRCSFFAWDLSSATSYSAHTESSSFPADPAVLPTSLSSLSALSVSGVQVGPHSLTAHLQHRDLADPLLLELSWFYSSH